METMAVWQHQNILDQAQSRIGRLEEALDSKDAQIESLSDEIAKLVLEKLEAKKAGLAAGFSEGWDAGYEDGKKVGQGMKRQEVIDALASVLA